VQNAGKIIYGNVIKNVAKKGMKEKEKNQIQRQRKNKAFSSVIQT